MSDAVHHDCLSLDNFPRVVYRSNERIYRQGSIVIRFVSYPDTYCLSLKHFTSDYISSLYTPAKCVIVSGLPPFVSSTIHSPFVSYTDTNCVSLSHFSSGYSHVSVCHSS